MTSQRPRMRVAPHQFRQPRRNSCARSQRGEPGFSIGTLTGPLKDAVASLLSREGEKVAPKAPDEDASCGIERDPVCAKIGCSPPHPAAPKSRLRDFGSFEADLRQAADRGP